jgi:hypothetical protein
MQKKHYYLNAIVSCPECIEIITKQLKESNRFTIVKEVIFMVFRESMCNLFVKKLDQKVFPVESCECTMEECYCPGKISLVCQHDEENRIFSIELNCSYYITMFRLSNDGTRNDVTFRLSNDERRKLLLYIRTSLINLK